MADKLPKVSIAVVGVVIAQIGGFIWWTAQQASTIQNLEETVNVLTVENNATDRTNLMRDVEENKEQIDEIIDYIVNPDTATQREHVVRSVKIKVAAMPPLGAASDEDKEE